MKAIILLAGVGVGVFNMLASQLGQLMCPLGYGNFKAGLSAGALILSGLVGSFLIGFTARKLRRQLDFAKVSWPLAAMSAIFLVMSLRFADAFPAILVSLMGFGFFGLGAFPLCLELAVEVRKRQGRGSSRSGSSTQFLQETFPCDPVISEAFTHASGFILITAGGQSKCCRECVGRLSHSDGQRDALGPLRQDQHTPGL